MKEKGKLATDDRTVWWELTYLVGLMYWSVTLQTVIPPAFNTFSTFSLLVVLVMAEMSRTTQSDIFSSSFGFFSVWKSGGRWQGSRCSCLYRWHTRGLGQILSRKIKILMTMRCRTWVWALGKPPRVCPLDPHWRLVRNIAKSGHVSVSGNTRH